MSSLETQGERAPVTQPRTLADVEMLHGNDANKRQHFDVYHSLADAFHEGLGRLLDDTLVRNGVTDVQTRKNIVSFFLFQTMNMLDDDTRIKLSQAALENDPNLEQQEPYARDTWYAALAFLRCKPSGVTGDLPGEVQTALICTDTWLHETSGEWEEAYFKSLENAENPA